MSALEAIREAGFVFWGLFAVFGAIVVGYVAWMAWVERNDSPPPPGVDPRPGGSAGPEPGGRAPGSRRAPREDVP